MTRIAIIAAALLLLFIVFSLVTGFSGAGATLMIVSLLCALPLMMFFVGLAVGAGSREYAIVRKQNVVSSQPTRRANPATLS